MTDIGALHLFLLQILLKGSRGQQGDPKLD